MQQTSVFARLLAAVSQSRSQAGPQYSLTKLQGFARTHFYFSFLGVPGTCQFETDLAPLSTSQRLLGSSSERRGSPLCCQRRHEQVVRLPYEPEWILAGFSPEPFRSPGSASGQEAKQGYPGMGPDHEKELNIHSHIYIYICTYIIIHNPYHPK